MSAPEHIRATTFHGRLDGPPNRFRYSVDYLLVDPDAREGPALFSRGRPNAFSLRDADHGGPPGEGSGADWARVHLGEGELRLLAQPRVLGHVFNPVSFWLNFRDGALVGVIAEVTNTYGDRHSYLLRHEDGRAIEPSDTLEARKVFHVSPFQDIAGDYRFTFDVSEKAISIRIVLRDGAKGLVATLEGARAPLTNLSIFRSLIRRPLGSRRVLALIHWQALRLWWQGVRFRPRPEPPATEISGHGG